MRHRYSHTIATTLCALALLMSNASHASSTRAAPTEINTIASAPTVKETAAANGDATKTVSLAKKALPLPLQPGDTIFCTISGGKKKAGTVRIVIPRGHTADELCPPARGRITDFILSNPSGSQRPVRGVLHAAPPVSGDVP